MRNKIISYKKFYLFLLCINYYTRRKVEMVTYISTSVIISLKTIKIGIRHSMSKENLSSRI